MAAAVVGRIAVLRLESQVEKKTAGRGKEKTQICCFKKKKTKQKKVNFGLGRCESRCRCGWMPGLGRRIDCHQGQEVPGCRGVVVVVEVEGGGKA